MLHIRQIPLPSSFSLRTLIICVTALCIWLGYQVNWIRQREAFLAEQFTRHLKTQRFVLDEQQQTIVLQSDPTFVSEWWHEQLVTGKIAPWPIRWFGEEGVGSLWVVVRESDVTLRTSGDDGLGPVRWPEISTSQPDYRRAKRLFPEAQVRPVRPNEVIRERDRRSGSRSSSGRHIPGVIVREQSQRTTIRLVCDSTAIENSVFAGRFELSQPSDGPVTIGYWTYDGTATTWQGNYDESSDKIVAEPGETTFPFTINIGALTGEQRAAGGATFSIKLDLVIGAVPEIKEKIITILPAKK